MTAVHNAIKYGTDLLRGFSRAVGLGEDEEGVVRLGETLTPTFDLWGGEEFAFLRRERLCGKYALQAAVAAEYSMIALVNRTGSNRLVVVDRVGVRTTAVVIASLRMASQAEVDATLLDVAQFGIVRDRRWTPLTTSPTGLAMGTDAVQLGLIMEDVYLPAAGSTVFQVALPVILSPGHAVVVAGSVLNQALVVHYAWREHQLLPGELGT